MNMAWAAYKVLWKNPPVSALADAGMQINSASMYLSTRNPICVS